MNLTVHIGTTKTGSSSIQRFLNCNSDQLRMKGILVPSSLGNIIHLNAVMASLPFGESMDLARVIKLTDARDHLAFRRNTIAAFQKELAASPDCREVVITAEYLHSRLPLRQHVQTFRDLFCRDFDKIRIVVYMRPQLDQIVSLYSTVLRSGYARPLNHFIRSRMSPAFRPYFDLRDVITRWGDVFGAENLVVRPYKAVSGKLGTLGDFCEVLDLDLNPDSEEWRIGGQVNTSINVAGQELLLLLNQTGALDAAHRRQVVKWAELHCTGHGATPPPKLARAFQSQFDESNHWVTETYFPGHPEYLEPRWPERVREGAR
ncbi:hypothetical protein Q0601_20405 [Paracoccus onubensis]|uniref:hypothetical protein n=1 Tax=Paracoccus onubensis TaxID=1675788 RepID=UPI00272F8263|nr:hypothetical protein [Paracoccus onubensis]MDP0929554.1 hypothetical protein [Paracoccus onubensis]